MFARRPFEMLQERQAPAYSAALELTWRAGWPAVVVLVLLAAVAAALAWRWHNRYARPNAIWWSGFVLLFNVPGLIAYRLSYEFSPVARCVECGVTVPRDRDACAHCDKPFAGRPYGVRKYSRRDGVC